MKQQTPPPTAPPKRARTVKRPPLAQGDGRIEAIRRTAYLLYEARGCVDGHELEDWLQAEVLVMQDSGAGADASAPATASKRTRSSARSQ